MTFLVNLIFAILAFMFVRYVIVQARGTEPLATIAALLVAVVVFLANLAAQVL